MLYLQHYYQWWQANPHYNFTAFGSFSLFTLISIRFEVLVNLILNKNLKASYICSSVAKLAKTIFWKQMNWFWCKLAHVVDGACHETINYEGQEVKGQGHMRSKRSGGPAEASFLTPLGPVAFLLSKYRSSAAAGRPYDEHDGSCVVLSYSSVCVTSVNASPWKDGQYRHSNRSVCEVEKWRAL